MDRNCESLQVAYIDVWSLSARRAWIEIAHHAIDLRAAPSLSARRAWIEIEKLFNHCSSFSGRSPQGERG